MQLCIWSKPFVMYLMYVAIKYSKLKLIALLGSNGKFHYLMVLSYNQHYQIRSPRYPCFWVDRKRNSFMWEMHLENLVRQFIQPSSAFSFHFTKLLSLFYINFLHFSTDSVVVLKFKLLEFQQRPNWIIEIECAVQRLQMARQQAITSLLKFSQSKIWFQICECLQWISMLDSSGDIEIEYLLTREYLGVSGHISSSTLINEAILTSKTKLSKLQPTKSL